MIAVRPRRPLHDFGLLWPDGSVIRPGQKVRSKSRFKAWDQRAGVGEIKNVTAKRVVVEWSALRSHGAYKVQYLERAA